MKRNSSSKFEGEGGASSDSKFTHALNANKLKFGFSFSGADGELGNSNEDMGDLPRALQKPGHIFNSDLENYRSENFEEKNEITSSMHVADKNSVGLSFSDEDNYLKE